MPNAQIITRFTYQLMIVSPVEQDTLNLMRDMNFCWTPVCVYKYK